MEMHAIIKKSKRALKVEAAAAIHGLENWMDETACGQITKAEFAKHFEKHWKDLPPEEQAKQTKLCECGNSGCRYANLVKKEIARRLKQEKEALASAAVAEAEAPPAPPDIATIKKEKHEKRKRRHERWELKRVKHASILPVYCPPETPES